MRAEEKILQNLLPPPILTSLSQSFAQRYIRKGSPLLGVKPRIPDINVKFAFRLCHSSLSLSLSPSSTRVSLSSPRVVSALVALDVPPISSLTLFLSLPTPEYFLSISSTFSLLPEPSPSPFEYTLTFYFPLVVKSDQPSTSFHDLSSISVLLRSSSSTFVSAPFLASTSRGVHVVETTNRARKRGRGREREEEGGLHSNRSDLRPASEKGNLGEPHTTTTTGEGEKVRWITNGPLGGN